MSREKRDRFLYQHEDLLLKIPVIGRKLEKYITTARIRVITARSMAKIEQDEINEILKVKIRQTQSANVTNPNNSITTPSSEFTDSSPNTPATPKNSEVEHEIITDKHLDLLAERQNYKVGSDSNIKKEYLRTKGLKKSSSFNGVLH